MMGDESKPKPMGDATPAGMSEPPRQAPSSRVESKVSETHWEEELRAGQEASGEKGSVEAELAIVHLLRHAASPVSLDAAREHRVWQGIATVFPTPWWKKPWVRAAGGSLGLVAAAVLLVWFWPPTQPQQSDRVQVASDSPRVLQASDADGIRAASAQAIEQQFALLELAARRRVAARIDEGRSKMRSTLLASLHPRGGSHGGAP